jgi:BlaI family penicillinase repressor
MPTPRQTSPQLPDLSPAEWDVMKVVWECGEAAARDIFAALPSEKGWAIKTVKTLLARLVAKGALDYVEVGNSYLYRAAHSREKMTRYEVDGFVDRVLDGAAAPVVAGFIRTSDLTSADIERLRALLDSKDAELKKARTRN